MKRYREQKPWTGSSSNAIEKLRSSSSSRKTMKKRRKNRWGDSICCCWAGLSERKREIPDKKISPKTFVIRPSKNSDRKFVNIWSFYSLPSSLSFPHLSSVSWFLFLFPQFVDSHALCTIYSILYYIYVCYSDLQERSDCPQVWYRLPWGPLRIIKIQGGHRDLEVCSYELLSEQINFNNHARSEWFWRPQIWPNLICKWSTYPVKN